MNDLDLQFLCGLVSGFIAGIATALALVGALLWGF